jgi:ppGpp synthetase/RelA/SpoT-type nucleotidyltranferase
MAQKTGSPQRFFRQYATEFPTFLEAAQQAQRIVESVIADIRPGIHLVTARPKNPESAFRKILRKSYNKPFDQLTDMIGVRIITYYENDVNRVVSKLTEEFEIDPSRSADRREILGLRSFGYRSVHLIARLKGFRASSSEYAALSGHWFEIQVRSILEHAWAEIEHEIVYKSGVNYPVGVQRRFAAIAGTLELIEKEFLALKKEKDNLIEAYRQTYGRMAEAGEKFDTARLLGLLEAEWPRNLSWRRAEAIGKPFPPHIEEKCVLALSKAKMSDARAIRKVFRSKRFRSVLRVFASRELLTIDNISHLAIVLLGIALRKRMIFETYFPEMRDNPSINSALIIRRRGKR